jgi:hypothetical protein
MISRQDILQKTDVPKKMKTLTIPEYLKTMPDDLPPPPSDDIRKLWT